MSPAQCRAARAFLDMHQTELAERAGVAVRTLISFEAGERQPMERTLVALRAALEAAGVEFLENGDGPGVRLRRISE